ncbi:MAG: N-acetylglucosamine-6-phosphate deacetylase, partial [Planctomycetota bacterium]
LKQSIDAGLQIFTHLGNGCPAMLPRHDHIINRVLSLSEQLAVSFIADGHHVPWLALRTYLQVVPATKVLIVSDAIAAAGLGAGRFQLGHRIFDVKEDLSTWSADGLHLTGCATTMPQMASLLKERLSVSDEQIETWMIHNPRRMLGA